MIEHGWGRSFSSAGLAFVISRGLLLLLAAGIGSLHREARTGMPDVPHAVLSAQGLTHQLGVLSRANDADWYLDIATHGYERRSFDASSQSNWAYFPLHPLLWRIGLGATGDGTLSGLLIANLLFLLGLAVVHRLAIASGRDGPTADRAVYALAFFPVSYFFSLPWSESLFVLLTAATFLFAGERRWLLVALTGALASATRLSGLFLMPALFFLLWPRRASLPGRAWVTILTIPFGLLGFMLVLWEATGNPLAFADIQSAWGREIELPFRAIGRILHDPGQLASDWNVGWLNLLALLLACLGGAHLVRRREYALAAFLLLGIAAPASSGTMMSMPRYAMGLFPLALALADWTENPTVACAWFGTSGALLAVMALAFVDGLTFAGA